MWSIRNRVSHKNLNIKSANGPDGISARLMNKYREYFSHTLCQIINECFRKGEYPKELKIGAVVPVHKSGSKEICANYRPITKLSTIDKIFESVLLNRLKSFLLENKIIDKNQFGFMENSNTLSACISCTEYIYENLDKKKYVALLAIDLSKAFDSVNLYIMIRKLAELGLNDKELKIFESFY